MVNREFFDALSEIAKDKRLDRDVIISACEAGLEAAYNKTFLENRKVHINMSEKRGDIEFVAYFKVVDTEPNEKMGEISVEDAQNIKEGAKAGDIISDSFDVSVFSRVAAKNLIQVFNQKINEAHKALISEEMNGKTGEIVRAVVRNVDNDTVTVEIVQTQMKGVMRKKDVIPGEKYVPGNTILVCVKKIEEKKNETYAEVTRSSAKFVVKLLEKESPELKTKIVVAKNFQRIPGLRTKIVVYSTDYNVDPVYACLGKGSERINNVSREINDERIDIIRYSENPVEFIKNCLSPTKSILDITVDEANKTAKVLIPDESYATAIGKRASNIRLASLISEYKIEIVKNSTIINSDNDGNN